MKTSENKAREYQVTSDDQIFQVENRQSKLYLGSKYILDVIFALLGLIILAPVIL
ncbi:sugar transferase, partial [Bacillus sp. OA1]|nr:sugar transferase [Bacillus sp. OA1]